MNYLKPVLHLLADGKFHSEQEISQCLGIPGNMVFDVIKSILDPSINLQITNLRNYRILGGLELLDPVIIQNKLGKLNQLLTQLEIITLVDSTNNYLLKKIGLTGNYAVFAEQQTAGRGQFNRPWISNVGKNIYLSLLWYFSKHINNPAGLTLVVGIAVIKALEEYGLKGIQLKWPNDIVYQEKKLGGILVESLTRKMTMHTVIIGIGLNLYYPFTTSAIEQAITDIFTIQKLPPQRNHLASLILKNLLNALLKFQTQGFVGFIQEWQRLDSLFNKTINIQINTNNLVGIARGVNLQGQLCVEINKKIYYFSNGEVRIKQK